MLPRVQVFFFSDIDDARHGPNAAVRAAAA